MNTMEKVVSFALVMLVLLWGALLAHNVQNTKKQKQIESVATNMFSATPEVLKRMQRLWRVEFEGHVYVVVQDGGLVHAESCPCKQIVK